MKAFAIDCGSVLFNNGTRAAIDTLVKVHGYDERIVRRMLFSEEALLLRKGMLTQEEFVKWMDRHLPEEYDAQVMMDEWHDAFQLDPAMFELMTELKIKHRIIVFSTNVKERVAILDRKFDILKYFDAHVWSFDHKATKKDSDAMYHALVKAAGCPPAEIGVIDDEDDVLERAKAHGMHAFRYAGDAGALRRVLRAAGVDLLP